MSFGNFLLTMVRNMTGDVVESSKEVKKFKHIYAKESLPILEKEYKRLKTLSPSKEITNRKMAVANLLVERRKKKK